MLLTINVASVFSRFPAGRFLGDGPASGEAFRENHLFPALRSGSSFELLLDGCAGFGSGFLDEAFGGIIRRGLFSANEMRARMRLTSIDESLKGEIWEIISNEKPWVNWAEPKEGEPARVHRLRVLA